MKKETTIRRKKSNKKTNKKLKTSLKVNSKKENKMKNDFLLKKDYSFLSYLKGSLINIKNNPVILTPFFILQLVNISLLIIYSSLNLFLNKINSYIYFLIIFLFLIIYWGANSFIESSYLLLILNSLNNKKNPEKDLFKKTKYFFRRIFLSEIFFPIGIIIIFIPLAIFAYFFIKHKLLFFILFIITLLLLIAFIFAFFFLKEYIIVFDKGFIEALKEGIIFIKKRKLLTFIAIIIIFLINLLLALILTPFSLLNNNTMLLLLGIIFSSITDTIIRSFKLLLMENIKKINKY